jgi:hypothetical protein
MNYVAQDIVCVPGPAKLGLSLVGKPLSPIDEAFSDDTELITVSVMSVIMLYHSSGE